MREFQVKKKVRSRLYSGPALIILGLLLVFFSKATWGVYQKEKESSLNTVEAKAELNKLEEREVLLKGEIGRLETEEGVEAEIRSKYSVSKPGEQVLIIVEKEGSDVAPMQVEESWWNRFKKLFE